MPKVGPDLPVLLVLAALLCLAGCGGGPRTLESPTEGFPDPTAARILDTVGFEGRRGWPSTVLHLDASEITGGSRLSLILDRADAVVLRRPEGTEWGVYLAGWGGGGTCPVAVYINGERVGRNPRPGSELNLDNLISTEAIAGLELHAGAEGPIIPGLDCGALLIWSSQADGVFRFSGEVSAVVEGASADLVTSVVLEPGSIQGRREGAYTYFSVLPGAYEVHFMGPDGPLDVQLVRAYAYAESEVVLEVN